MLVTHYRRAATFESVKPLLNSCDPNSIVAESYELLILTKFDAVPLLKSFSHLQRNKNQANIYYNTSLIFLLKTTGTMERRLSSDFNIRFVAVVAEWYRHRIVARFVTSSSPVPLKTRRVGQRCTLNLSRAETSSRWCGVVVRRGGASSGVVHVT
ncbi:uncharacterized protein TNCV_2558341 [Trichonephila clavipes]|nr:uncharacterized protein TNCV_2558341 [Trichonephila clavipes]